MVDKFKNLTLSDKNYHPFEEEFPKLRKPKESTLQKLRANQKINDNAKVSY